MKNNIKINKKEVKEAIANKKEIKKVKDNKNKEEKVKNSIDKQDWHKTYNYRPFAVALGNKEESKTE